MANEFFMLIQESFDCVESILSFEAPEGHLLKDVQENILHNELNQESMYLMSCSWRVIKYGCEMIPLLNHPQSEPLLRSLLLKVRHVGAFSCIFPSYLQVLQQNSKECIHQWLIECLKLLNSKYPVTRRSGGKI